MNRDNHAFNFDGGEILCVMGASWFVSFAYYRYVDRNHCAWKKVNSYPSRIDTYYKSTEYHAYWLERITEMNERRLSTNKIGLKGTEVKIMAKEILSIMK